MAGDATVAGLVAGIIMKEDEQKDELDDQDDHPASGPEEVPELSDRHKRIHNSTTETQRHRESQ
jgi:hypothetical protein